MCSTSVGKKGVSLIIFVNEHEAKEPYYFTKYGKKIIINTRDPDQLLSSVISLDKKYNYLIFPTTDAGVLTLSQQRHKIPAHCKLLFPPHQLIENLMIKDQFENIALNNGLDIPQTILVKNTQDIISAKTSIQFPIIAKTPQKVYKANLKKAYIIQSPEELTTWYEDIKSTHDEYIIQQYIPGEDSDVYFVMVFIDEQYNLRAVFSGKKIRQWPPICGGTASAIPVDNQSLVNLTFNFFKKIKFWGIGSMEYKFDRRSNKYYAIEPTVCRTDFQEAVAVENDVNIPYAAYVSVKSPDKLHSIIQQRRGIKYGAWVHLTADQLARNYYIKNNKLSLFSWILFLLTAKSFDLFSWYDTKPLWNLLISKIIQKAKFFKNLFIK